MKKSLPETSKRPGGPCQQAGFSIVELMIAVTVGLLVVAALSTVFVNTSQTRAEIERNNRQIESGRYASSILAENLHMAGFFGAFDPYELIIKAGAPPLGGATPMTSMPDPCETTVTGNASSLINSFFVHVQGIDNVTTATTPSCLSDVKTGSDILVIRRVSSCVAGPTAGAGCDAAIAGVPYFQASNCYLPGELATNTGASSTDYLAHFAITTDTTTAGISRGTPPTGVSKRALDCTAIADYRRYMVQIYFVANNNVGSDGIPTLKRAELGATSGGVATWNIVPLVDGIETIQFEYGMDTDNDGRVNVFNANPGTYGTCVGVACVATPCVGAACVANWLTTYVVKVNVLAKNTEASPNFSTTKTYILGKLADGTTDNTFGPFSDAFKRHAFTSVVKLDNPAGRKLP